MSHKYLWDIVRVGVVHIGVNMLRKYILGGVVTFIGVLFGVSVIAQENQPIKEENAPKHAEVYKETGADKKLKTKEEVTEKRLNKGKIKSTELKNMGDVEQEIDLKRVVTINPNRKVYKVVVDFPEGLETTRGKFNKASVTSIIDAETGIEFVSYIESDPADTTYTNIPKP